jgi:hypothetical protein
MEWNRPNLGQNPVSGKPQQAVSYCSPTTFPGGWKHHW